MMKQQRDGFTMLELVFVIVIIGILSAIAVPKLATTRDDALITKAKTTIASIRNAILTKRQKRILSGDFTNFTSLGGNTGTNQDLFDYFNGNAADGRILEIPLTSCKSALSRGCWMKTNNTTYVYRVPLKNVNVTFTFDQKSRFDCDATLAGDAGRYCKMLTR
jgi:general secretion pathway protein G